ncbi:MAG: matrixin family metalloprotease [Acidobacteria bacterium]|nr:matrixin family metalloprotease [Acidobacteriota bacterium]
MTRRGWRTCGLLVTVVSALMCVGGPVEAYLKLGVFADGRFVSLRWDRSVEYFVTNRDVPDVTAPQLQAVIGRAFSSWAGVPRTSIRHQFVGFTSAEPVGGDGISVVGFQSRPELERTLAAVSFEIDDLTGRILEADMFFNTSYAWSVASAGRAGSFDLESVGLHEVGHVLGLGHSALGETELRAEGGRRVLAKGAVMFPIAYSAGSTEDRTLKADDRAGITDIYCTSEADQQTGSVSGRVTLNGEGIFGAHVTAVHTSTGEMISGFSLTANGAFSIGELPPGLYILRVEPLDDADLASFFADSADVNVDFVPTFHAQLVAVPAGGAGPAVAIAVKAK